MDAYFGFLTLYVWVFYKELRRLPRIAWFVAITLLGNMAWLRAFVKASSPSIPATQISSTTSCLRFL